MRLLTVDQFRENVVLAVDALRVSKLRSALTVLGVVIGVATVMTMGTIVNGVQSEIIHTIEIAGPTTFYVVRVFAQGDPNNLPPGLRNRPESRRGGGEFESRRSRRSATRRSGRSCPSDSKSGHPHAAALDVRRR